MNPDIVRIVNENKHKVEPYGEIVDTALHNLRANLIHNQDSYAQQENDEVENLLQAANELSSEDPEDEPVLFVQNENTGPSNICNITLQTDSEINSMICSLNKIQRDIFDVVMKWARDYVKHLSCV